MRIISGLYKGRVLKSPSGNKTRPTSDRLRETLFNIISPRINDETRFLDLCAGTGAVGIEALSRGCSSVAFVDKSRRACALIEENLDLLQIPEEKTGVHCNSADKFIFREKDKNWDVLFYDPPYEEDYSKVLLQISKDDVKALASDGIFIAEHHSKAFLPDSIGDIRRWRLVKQGENCLSLYEKS